MDTFLFICIDKRLHIIKFILKQLYLIQKLCPLLDVILYTTMQNFIYANGDNILFYSLN